MSSTEKKKRTNQRKTKKPKDKPSACTKEELTRLLVQASSLSVEEARIELLECCRYGEIDAVCAILDTFEHQSIGESRFIDCMDENGNTALHKSCANGHTDVTKLLLERGIAHVSNKSGNTPLHWAAGNGHVGCVEAIVKVVSVDVLEKNEFGRSALTEGFSSEVTEVVGLLLEHDSAEEERLLGKIHVEDEEKVGVVHEFSFGDTIVSIRELAIKHADNPFGKEPKDDTTGLGIWCASIIMSQWIAQGWKDKLKDKVLLELGAGCGLPALTAALYSNPKSVYISDLNPETLQNIKYNIQLNQLNTNIQAISLDWQDTSTYPKTTIDYILGSDLIYQQTTVPILKNILCKLLKPNATFLYVAPKDYLRHGLSDFIHLLQQKSHYYFECKSQMDAPQPYKVNPLKSGDDDDCFLHFHELASMDYVLYEFVLRVLE